MAGDGHDSTAKQAPEMPWTQAVLKKLSSRNARERGKWGEVFAELTELRSELVAAKATHVALQREAVAASVACPDADLSGLLADTPVAPSMREQLSVALKSQLAPPSSRSVPLDPLLISGCDAVIAFLLATSPSPSPSAANGSGAAGLEFSAPPSPGGIRSSSLDVGGAASHELRIGDLEACFAGCVCRHRFSKASSIVALCSKYTKGTDFREFVTVLWSQITGAPLT